MTMRDLHHNIKPLAAVGFATFNTAAGTVQGSNVDRRGYEGVQVIVAGTMGDLTSAVVKLEHADDDGSGSPGTFSDVTDNDMALTKGGSVSSGNLPALTALPGSAGSYVGEKAWLRASLTVTATAGGPAGVTFNADTARHAPVTDTQKP